MRLAWITVAVTGLLLPLVCQAFRPLSVLGHEFAALLTAASLIVLYMVTPTVARTVAAGPGPRRAALSGALSRSLLMALVLGALALVTMLVANAASHHCRFGGGVGFAVVTWVPAALLACVGGVIAGARGWSLKRRLAVLGLALAVTGVHDVTQFWWGPRIVDLFIGKPEFINIRADMTIPLVHWWQRLWVLGAAVTLWHVGLWRMLADAGDPGDRDAARADRDRGLVLGAVLTVIALGWGSHLGLGWGRGALHQALSEVHRTDHFEFHYARGGRAETYLDAVAREAEWSWHALTTEWGIEPDRVVRVYLFDDHGSIGELTNVASAHAYRGTIYLDATSGLREVFGHELVHILDFDLGGSWLASANRGAVEGFAEAYESDYLRHPQAHAGQAAALRGGTLPAATELMSLLGFFTVDESNAYMASGSFVGFLIMTYGLDRWIDARRDLDWQRAYGRDLVALDAEWREFLSRLPRDLETEVTYRDWYDPSLKPGYFSEKCPKLGPLEVEADKRAALHFDNGDVAGALAIYRELRAAEPGPRWAYQEATCLRWLRRHDEALAVADEILATPDLDEAEQFRFVELRLACLMDLQAWDDIAVALDRRDKLQQPSPDRSMIRACLEDPQLRGPAAAAVNTTDWVLRVLALHDLATSHPEHEAAVYLYLTRGPWNRLAGGYLGLEPGAEPAIEQLMASLEARPAAADAAAPTVLNLVAIATRARRYDLARDIAERLAATVRSPLIRIHAEHRLMRIAWEQQRDRP